MCRTLLQHHTILFVAYVCRHKSFCDIFAKKYRVIYYLAVALTKSSDYPLLVQSVKEAIARGDMQALEGIVLNYRHSEYAGYLMMDLGIEALIPQMRKAYCEYETKDERRLRDELVAQGAPLIAGSAPIERTYKYVPLEAAAAGIDNSANYCHVGSGPFPETLIAMRKFAPRAALWGIDADFEATDLAREFADAAWPGAGITFGTAQGRELDYRTFTHVHVAVLVRPETDVVRAICETGDPGVKVMLRTAESLGTWLYQPIAQETEEVLKAYGFTRREYVRGHAIMNTAIYQR